MTDRQSERLVRERLAARMIQRQARLTRRLVALERRFRAIYAAAAESIAQTARRDGISALGSLDDRIDSLLRDAAGQIRRELSAVGRDAHRWGVEAIMAAVPLWWLLHYARRRAVPTLEARDAPGEDPDAMRIHRDLERARGLPPAEARAMVQSLMFPMPSPERIDAILGQPGPGGVPWDERLRSWESRTRGAMRAEITAGLAGDENVDSLRKRLRPLADGLAWKAQRIARTEGARLAHRLSQETFEAMGDAVEGQQIVASLDEHTRPEHAARHGRVYRRGPDGLFRDQSGAVLPDLPDAPNCLLPGQAVSGLFCGGLRAHYSGQAIKITVATGVTLAVTPNHRILTQRGWVVAKKVHEGDNLIRYLGVVERPSVMPLDDDQKPTAINQVYDTIAERGTSLACLGVDVNLHGDEAACDGQIQIVRADRSLLMDRDSTAPQLHGKPIFFRGPVQPSELSRPGPLEHSLHAVTAPTSGSPSLRALSFDGGTVRLDFGPLELFRVGPAADLHAVLLESGGEANAADPGLVRNLFERFPSLIATDQVTQVRNVQWSGHVYDLQSVIGWYACQGIILHNCRCMAIPDLGMPDYLQRDPAARARYEKAAGELVPDAASYGDWWGQASQSERKAAVGVGRYAAVRDKLGREPTWADFLGPDGKLLGRSQIMAETPAERTARLKGVEATIAQRRQEFARIIA